MHISPNNSMYHITQQRIAMSYHRTRITLEASVEAT